MDGILWRPGAPGNARWLIHDVNQAATGRWAPR